ncbi:methyltransferase domain-containing protein [Aromatoleum sp.]|uniref:methyltransferase domain-containing protein n=1 Tax=Aromatoleum sp. TaxID=2307007 RepID=UPI002FC868B2
MSASGFDARRFKTLERAGFNRIAARYADTAHLRAALADALLDAAELAPGQTVLDLASGPGLLARAAAQRVQPGGWVLASDIAEEMLAEGARRAADEATGATHDDAGAAHAGGPAAVSFAAADAEHLCVPDTSFDRVLAGLALFMFPHPDNALAEMRRALRPGGRVVLSVWGVRDEVPLIARAQDCIARLLPAPKVARPSVFRFGEPAVLEAALGAAGFGDVRITPCRFTCTFADAAEYWQAFLDLAGGAAEALARLPDATQQQLRDAVTDELAPHRPPDGAGYAVDALALVASARA